MRASQMFPSRFLKAVDLLNAETNEYREATVTVDHMALEPVGQEGDDKPVLHLKETKKLMPLNKTNMMTLATNLGDETDGWDGQKITLYVTQEPFNGQVYDVVRVKPRPRGGGGQVAGRAADARAKAPSLGDTTTKANGPTKIVPTLPLADDKDREGLDPDSIPF